MIFVFISVLNCIDLEIIIKLILLNIMEIYYLEADVGGAYFSTVENLVLLFLEFKETLVSLPV